MYSQDQVCDSNQAECVLFSQSLVPRRITKAYFLQHNAGCYQLCNNPRFPVRLQSMEVKMDHSPFLGMESSFYRRSKINKYTRRLLKTRRGRLDFTLWPYEDYSITQDDSPRMTRWGTITWRELLHETRWLDEDHSTRVTQRGWLDEGNSTRVTRRGDDSKRTTRRGSHDEARWFNETTLSHKGGTSVLRIVLTSLFYFFFSIIWNVQSIINYIYGQSIVLLIIDTFHFISFSIIILSAFLPANFVTWMIMVLMVFSILFQDHEFNATNCRHKHSCAFSPCLQIYFSTF